MGLKDRNTVDIVMREPGPGSRAALIIYDAGDISDNHARETALHEKLATYLNFVRSGQLVSGYPQLTGCAPFIKIICRTSPTVAMTQIESVGASSAPEISLPVEIVTEEDFRRTLKRE